MPFPSRSAWPESAAPVFAPTPVAIRMSFYVPSPFTPRTLPGAT